LNKAVLRAAVLVPYPWLYKFPYPHAPPAKRKNPTSNTILKEEVESTV
jgi:hypothetical protein